MLKAQLHAHSKEDKVDQCLKYDAKELIDRVSSLGFEVLAFTFHDHLFYPDEIIEYAVKKNVLLIPGVGLLWNLKIATLMFNFQKPIFVKGSLSGTEAYLDEETDAFQVSFSMRRVLNYYVPWLYW